MHRLVELLLLSILITCGNENGAHDQSNELQSSRHPENAALLASDSSQVVMNFQAIELSGKPFKSVRLKGKTVLLDFWAVWCAPCIAAFPTLKKLNKDLAKENFEVVGIAVYSGGPAEVSKFIERYEIDYKIIVGDADLVERFGVIGYPTYFLIGPSGNIRKRYVGEARNLYSEVMAEVQKLKGAK